jgi:methyltransferase
LIVEPVILVVGLVALQRLGELAYARRNTARLLAAGAHEAGRRHYPLFIILHGGWLAALVLGVPHGTQPDALLLCLFGLLQLARVWVVLSLGQYWTTRVIVPLDAPLVRKGPYRWLRHPNYAVVVGEIALLPLAFNSWPIAVMFSVLNLALLAHRTRIENRALAPRRNQADHTALKR